MDTATVFQFGRRSCAAKYELPAEVLATYPVLKDGLEVWERQPAHQLTNDEEYGVGSAGSYEVRTPDGDWARLVR